MSGAGTPMTQADSDAELTKVGASGVLIALGATLVVAIAFLTLGSQALLLFVVPFVAVFALAMLRWPDLATLTAVGLIYSNLPVVAVNFHGAPAVLPAAALGLFAWPLFYRVFYKGEPVLFLPATPWVVLLVGVQGAGAWFSSDVPYAMGNFIAFVLEGAAFYLILINVLRTRTVLVGCFVVLAGCAVLMGGVPLVQQLTGNFEFTFGGLAQVDAEFATEEDAVLGQVSQRRAAGTIGEQNRYGQFMILLAPVGLALFYLSRNRLGKTAAGFAAVMAVIGFALAFSRGAAVGVVATVLVAALLGLISKRQLKQIALVGAFTLLLLPQYLVRLSSLGGLVGVVSQSPGGLNDTDGAVRGRLTEMLGAAMAFRDRPLIGVGPGMFRRHSQMYGQIIGLRPLPDGRQAHSLPLDIAAEHGLLGLIAMTGLIFVVFRRLLRARAAAVEQRDWQAEQLSTAALLMLLLYLTTALFLHLSYIRYFWLLIGLCETIAFVILTGERGETYLPSIGWLNGRGGESAEGGAVSASSEPRDQYATQSDREFATVQPVKPR